MAQTNLGGFYKKGQGVAKDEAETVRWYRKAAEQGNNDEVSNLAECYRGGFEVQRDEAEAARMNAV